MTSFSVILIKYRPEWREGQEGKVNRDYQEPSDELQRIFENYLEKAENLKVDFDNSYSEIYDLIEGLDPVPEEVNNLLLLYPEKDSIVFNMIISDFISTSYNITDQETIVFETETDNSIRIGNKLNSDKTLIIKSDVADVGKKNRGTIINLATIDHGFCDYNEGLCINAGRVNGLFAEDNSGVAINLNQSDVLIFRPPAGLYLNLGGEIGNIGIDPDFPGTFISTNKIPEDQKSYLSKRVPDDARTDFTFYDLNDLKKNPELKQYLNQLEEGLGSSVPDKLDFLQEVGSSPGQTIREEINGLIGDSN